MARMSEHRKVLNEPFWQAVAGTAPKPSEEEWREAERLALEAMSQTGRYAAVDLAVQAVARDPYCLDGWRVLGMEVVRLEEEPSNRFARFLRHLIQMGQQVQRPGSLALLRTMETLALHLREIREVGEAVAQMETALRLDPGDPLQLRGLLLGLYLDQARLESVEGLLIAYPADTSATFAWGKVLWRYLQGDLSTAQEALAAARQTHPQAEDYLALRRDRWDVSLRRRGREDIAACVRNLGPSWAGKMEEDATWLRKTPKALRPPAPLKVYQFKVTLQYIDPPIWRRFRVHNDLSLQQIHDILQTVMGWEDDHLWRFEIQRVNYSPVGEDGFDTKTGNANVSLNQAVRRKGARFLYEYDMGDSWWHLLELEQVLPLEPDTPKAVCLEGQRACPPEDIGGIGGYESLLEAIRDPEKYEESEFSAYEWGGPNGSFDPEAFDVDAVNRKLARMFGSRRAGSRGPKRTQKGRSGSGRKGWAWVKDE